MKKHGYLFSIITTLLLVMVICIMTPKAEAVEIENGRLEYEITWSFDDNGTLTISGIGKMNCDFDANYNDYAPWWKYRDQITKVVIEDGVTSIAAYSFYQCKNLSEVEIPNSVTYIGELAFYNCLFLKSIELPKNITHIGGAAFMYCKSLETIDLPNKLTVISGGIFSDCISLKSVVIPENVIDIEGAAFYGCTSLTSVTIGKNVKNIYNYAFQDCTGLTDMVIPDGVVNIYDYVFSGCTSLKNIDIPDSVLYFGLSVFDNTIWYENQPEGMVYAGKVAYGYKGTCPQVITFKNDTLGIAGYAFQNCTNITSVTIPGSIVSIGNHAFDGCTKLTSMDIPDNVTRIRYHAFDNCTGLKSVTIGNGVTTIDDGAFEACTGLTSIEIPDNIKTIGNRAFSDCTGLTWVTVGSGVDVVDEYAFSGCTKLKEIIFAGNAPDFEYSAFCDVTAIIYYQGVDPSWTSDMMYNYGGTITWLAIQNIASGSFGGGLSWTLDNAGYLIISGNGAMPDYSYSSVPWYSNRTLVKRGIIQNGVTHIGEDAFYGCKNMLSVKIPSSVVSIGDDAFYGCSGLTSVYISDIEAWCGIVFEDYTSNPINYAKKLHLNRHLVTDLVITDGITQIGAYAFYNCKSLVTVTIPDSVTIVGKSAFYYCSGLTNVYCNDLKQWSMIQFENSSANPLCYADNFYVDNRLITAINESDLNGVTSIGDYAFSGYQKLTSVKLPDSITVIGAGAFYSCSGITAVAISNGIETIETNAFYYCTGLTTIIIPESVTYIGTWAFQYCSKLAELRFNAVNTTCGSYVFDSAGIAGNGINVIIGSQVTQIPASLFVRSNTSPKIISVTFEEGSVCTTIGGRAFRGCGSLTSVALPNSVTIIGESAFGDCSALKEIWVDESNQNFSTDEFGVLFNKNKTTLIQAPGAISGSYSIPDSVTSISKYAFYNCNNLTSVTIGKGVTTMGDYAFQNCGSLTLIQFNAVNMNGLSNSNTVFTKVGQNGTGIKVIIGAQVTQIPDYLFYFSPSYAKITSIEFEESGSCQTIGKYAFYGCTGLTSVDIADCVSTVSDYAFSKCTGLKKVTFGSGVTTIKGEVFTGCSGLKEIIFNGNAPSISYGAFRNITATAYCYAGEDTWLNGAQSNYGGSITWVCAWPRRVIASGSCGQNLTWELDNYGELTISGTGVMKNCKSYSDQPWDAYDTNIQSVVIKSGVTSIGSYAFASCYNVKTVTIPETVRAIGYSAFAECSGMTGVYISDLAAWCQIQFVTDTYNNNPLYYAKNLYCDGALVTTLNASDLSGVTAISDCAFYKCTNLTSVTIPDSVISIGDSAFYYCTGMTSVTIPDSVTAIGNSAFYYCTGLTGVYISDLAAWCEIDFEDNDLIYHAKKIYLDGQLVTAIKSTDLAGVTSIGENAFSEYSYLTTVSMPDSVTEIGAKAFYGCSNLTSVAIGNGVTRIGQSAFMDCTNLSDIYIPDSIEAIDGGAFLNTAWYNNQPEGLIYVGKVAYTYKGTCPDTISIKEDTLGIAGGAFSGCTGLTSVFLPNSLTNIGMSAFGRSGLIKIEIPDRVVSIGAYAFADCGGLEEVMIGTNVVTIGHAAFDGCVALKKVYFNAANASDLENLNFVFASAGKNGNGVNVIIGAQVTRIPSYLFYPYDMPSEAAKIISVEFEEGSTCKSIGEYVFYEQNELWKIIIPDSVTTIGNNAFGWCGNLSQLSLGNGVEIIGNHAFASCRIDRLDLPDSLVSIGRGAFSGNRFSSLKIGANVKNIGDEAFQFCNSLTEVRIISNDVLIGSSVFAYSNYIQKIVFVGAVPNFSNRTFYSITTTAYYLAGDATWTEDVRQNYGGTITWIPYDGLFEVAGTEYLSFAEAMDACDDGQWLKLKESATINVTLTEDLHIDLNGYNVSGLIVTNGYKVYGMDSTTNSYTCDSMGYFSCIDESGNEIAPQSVYTAENMMRYMTIETEQGYTFHRFYLGITNLSLVPAATGFGYKAEFYGDEMVQSKIASIGYNLWLTENYIISRTSAYKTTLTLRLSNFDVVNYGETPVNASVFITLTDGTVIEGSTVSYSMRQVVEEINEYAADLNEEKMSAVRNMIANHAIMQGWLVENIYKKEL